MKKQKTLFSLPFSIQNSIFRTRVAVWSLPHQAWKATHLRIQITGSQSNLMVWQELSIPAVLAILHQVKNKVSLEAPIHNYL